MLSITPEEQWATIGELVNNKPSFDTYMEMFNALRQKTANNYSHLHLWGSKTRKEIDPDERYDADASLLFSDTPLKKFATAEPEEFWSQAKMLWEQNYVSLLDDVANRITRVELRRNKNAERLTKILKKKRDAKKAAKEKKTKDNSNNEDKSIIVHNSYAPHYIGIGDYFNYLTDKLPKNRPSTPVVKEHVQAIALNPTIPYKRKIIMIESVIKTLNTPNTPKTKAININKKQ